MAPSIFNTGFVPGYVPGIDSIIDDKRSKKLAQEQSESYTTFPDGHLVGITQEESNIIPNHYTADRDPTPSDDYLDGWREGSKWYNIPKNNIWLCVESTEHHTVWRRVDNTQLYPEVYDSPLPIVSIGDGLYDILLPEDTMIHSILRVYIINQGIITAGFNFDPVKYKMTLNMELYPKVNFDGKQAVVTFTRRGIL